MRKSFPVLIRLVLSCSNVLSLSAPFPVIPQRFLGRSAPSLQHLSLRCISFPRLPTFLLSARNIVTLELEAIPPNGYISPEVMARSLSALTKLTTLSISFFDDYFPEDQRRSHPDPPIRAIFPALVAFEYGGCNEYLEDFLARIDTPRLNQLGLYYFMREIEALQLSRFIQRTEHLSTAQFARAEVTFYNVDVSFNLDCPRGNSSQALLALNVNDPPFLEEQVRSMVAIVPDGALFSCVDHLYAHGDFVDTTEISASDWLPFFRLFPAVRTLRLYGGVESSFFAALEDTTEDMIPDVFPALHLIWLVKCEDKAKTVYHDPVGSIDHFLSLRQLAGRPVTIVYTKDEFDEAETNLLGHLKRPVGDGLVGVL